MDSLQGCNDLAQVIAAFKSLPASSQAEALRVFHETQQSTRTDSDTVKAHSCGLCNSIRITWDLPEAERSSYWRVYNLYYPGSVVQSPDRYASTPLSLTKDALSQGLSRECMLFQWIFELLDRNLSSFKEGVIQNGVFVRLGSRNAHRDHTLDNPKHSLDYIDSGRGLDLQIEYFRSREQAILNLAYDPDPAVLDNLWAASNMSPKRTTYTEFEQVYQRSSRMTLTVCTTSDDPASELISKRPAISAPTAEDSFRLAREWLNECSHEHHHCTRREGILPSRVIDVGSRSPVRTVKLHWTEEGETGQYIALSYCWGGKQSLVTTTATAQEYTDGLPVSKIPRTILDAINLTNKLGLRFLWVDALCILQDDPEDVAREVSKMAQIYQEAWVTVSAACAKSVDEGFLQQQRIQSDLALKLPITVRKGVEGFIYLQQPHTYSSVEDPIHLRAWTLQEHILPRRILLFGTQGLFWTCSSKEYSNVSNKSEANSMDRPTIVPGKIASTHPTIFSWRSIVRGYTRRFLTVTTDKLPAIAGVAAQYSETFGSGYLAGLWDFDLISELMWCSTRSDITRPVVQRAPSWSWAAVDGEIHHNWCPTALDSGSPRIINCTTAPTSRSSPFGSVEPQQCMLRLRGYLAEVYWYRDRKRLYPWKPDAADFQDLPEIGRSQADALEVSTHGTGIKAWALLIQNDPYRGLLLVHVDGDKFRRVGIFYRIWETDACQFEQRMIEIV